MIEVTWRTTVRDLQRAHRLEAGDRCEVTCPHKAVSEQRAGQATTAERGTLVVELLSYFSHCDVEAVPRNGIDPRQWARSASGFQFTTHNNS